jgi:hypothetical protein
MGFFSGGVLKKVQSWTDFMEIADDFYSERYVGSASTLLESVESCCRC